MGVLEIIAIIMCIFSSLFFIYMMIRIRWVHNKRVEILYNSKKSHRENLEDYNKLCSFDAMIWIFWIWDIEKFKK